MLSLQTIFPDTLELLKELSRSMSVIAENEGLMKRLLKYAKKLASENEDSALLSKEDFFARIEEAEHDIAEGKGVEMLQGETLDDFLRRA